MFFVSSGIRLDLQGLLDSPSALLRVPVFLLALLVMRGVPALLLRPRARAPARRGRRPAAGDVAAVHRHRHPDRQVTGRIDAVTAAAMVSAGLLSVLIFPAVSLSLLRRATVGEHDAVAVRLDLR